ncbi:molecular chaperone DnaJ [Haliangium sp.]|uniref:molecular chaperone DnaJ n=1 Tax=Haliangium sp. TaxID=2663208 RepID=UPI003D1032CE
MATQRDYYEVLGVSRDAGEKQIKEAFRRLAKAYHPDHNKAPDAEERFKQIAEAYAVLSDRDKRAAYDAGGFAGVDGATGGDPFSGLDIEDLFRGMGVGGFPGVGDLFGRRRAQAGPRRGDDLYMRLSVPLDTVLHGDTRHVRVTKPGPCPDCHGSGAKPGTQPRTCAECGGSGQRIHAENRGQVVFQQVSACTTCGGRGVFIDEPCATCAGRGVSEQSEDLDLKIPPGIREGMSLRIPGHGRAGQGGPPGDLFVVVNTEPDPRFERRGADLAHEVSLDVVDAVLGCEVDVPTLEGHAKVTVPAGTQPGAVLRLRGKGLPHLGATQRGDLYLSVIVDIPRELTPDELEHYQRLRDLGQRRGKKPRS